MVDMHIIKSSKGSHSNDGKRWEEYVYRWDSLTNRVIFGECVDDLRDPLSECTQAVKSLISISQGKGDVIGTVILGTVFVVVVTALLRGFR